jgi:Fe-S cluster assembly protein SufB
MNNSSSVEHEASTSKISEEQLFYLQQRGISQEDAVSLIINGFCKDVSFSCRWSLRWKRSGCWG